MEEQIALAMGLSLSELQSLAHTDSALHYNYFSIKKKSGFCRVIYEPSPSLKKAQKWLLKVISNLYKPPQNVHGFCKGRSIVTNAKPHVGMDIIINIDLQDFFPSISFDRVYRIFDRVCFLLNYSKNIATIFSQICTVVDLNPKSPNYQKCFLPQGFPTSPILSNFACYNLDLAIIESAKKYGFTYTRYADDLTFSGSKKSMRQQNKFVEEIKIIINQENFKINDRKTKALTKSVRQEVTGIVVNKKINIAKDELKAFRATLYQIEREGLEGKTWESSTNLMMSISGFANYVNMINPSHGKKFLESIDRIQQKHLSSFIESFQANIIDDRPLIIDRQKK
jgi:RNA-directed DNA polymerase